MFRSTATIFQITPTIAILSTFNFSFSPWKILLKMKYAKLMFLLWEKTVTKSLCLRNQMKNFFCLCSASSYPGFTILYFWSRSRNHELMNHIFNCKFLNFVSNYLSFAWYYYFHNIQIKLLKWIEDYFVRHNYFIKLLWECCLASQWKFKIWFKSQPKISSILFNFDCLNSKSFGVLQVHSFSRFLEY